MIGISLGNSHLGRLAIDVLLEQGVEPASIVAVVRDTAKAGDLRANGILVQTAAYGEEDTLAAAFEGVKSLYMISGTSKPGERRKQHRGVIDAAKRAGVERIVYTSFIDTADDSPFFAWNINRDTETNLEQSGLDFTILRNGLYSEADLDYVPRYLEAGQVENNIGDGKISYISRRDLARAATHCLLDDGHGGETYTLTGLVAVTQSELAALISTWTGKEIPYVPISDEAYRRTFPDPAWADVVVSLYRSVRAGNCEAVTGDFEQIVGRKPFTLDETWNLYYAGDGQTR
jgi:NAD(P)H dehydrogenase (quinone)